MTVLSGRALRLDGRQFQLLHDAVVASYDIAVLRQDVRIALDRRLDELAGGANFREITFDLIETAEREGRLHDLLTMFKGSRYPAVVEVASRLVVDCTALSAVAAVEVTADPVAVAMVVDAVRDDGPADARAAAPTDPYAGYLVAQQPFVDRADLREGVRDLLSLSRSRVLVVTGERPCGKSYSWLYVRHLTEVLGGVVPVLVDLSDWVGASRPIDVMSSVALQLRLKVPEVDEHAQGPAQAQRLRDWLVGQLHGQDGPEARWVLVVDSIDHAAQREDTLQLIEFLAGAAIRQRLAGLRVILLGYADRLPIDPLESVLTEEIQAIGEPQLRDYFRSLADQERLAITDEAVDLAVRGVLSLLPAERDRRLRQLPKAVRAVGNAAFGRQVLP